MSSKHQKWIYKYFPKSPIAYQPGLSLVFRSVSVGILLSQLLYWHEKGANKEGWVYKTIEEMQAETGLTRNQQDTAIRICRTAGILECKLGGVPAKRHFRINMKELENQLPSLKKSANVAFLNPPIQFDGNQQTITNSTQNTTTKNTRDRFRNNSLQPVGDISALRIVDIKSKKPNDFGNRGVRDE